MENLKGFMYPATAKCEKITIFRPKTAIWDLYVKHGHSVCRPRCPIFA